MLRSAQGLDGHCSQASIALRSDRLSLDVCLLAAGHRQRLICARSDLQDVHTCSFGPFRPDRRGPAWFQDGNDSVTISLRNSGWWKRTWPGSWNNVHSSIVLLLFKPKFGSCGFNMQGTDTKRQFLTSRNGGKCAAPALRGANGQRKPGGAVLAGRPAARKPRQAPGRRRSRGFRPRDRDLPAVRRFGWPESPSGAAGGGLYGVRLKPGRHALPCSRSEGVPSKSGSPSASSRT